MSSSEPSASPKPMRSKNVEKVVATHEYELKDTSPTKPKSSKSSKHRNKGEAASSRSASPDPSKSDSPPPNRPESPSISESKSASSVTKQDQSSEDSSTETIDESQIEAQLATQDMDLSRPVTSSYKSNGTPRRHIPIMHIVGAEEMQYRPDMRERWRRVFVFTPQGRAVSVQVDPDWTSCESLYAAVNDALGEPELKIVTPTGGFTHAYFYPSMADVEDLNDICNNDQLVVVTTKLEPGQVLNALGGTRGRSHSVSGHPSGGTSPRGISSPGRSEWSHIVPVVEPSFHLSTLTFERHSTLETERFSRELLSNALARHHERMQSEHISDLLHHIESFAGTSTVAPPTGTLAMQSASMVYGLNDQFSASLTSMPDYTISTPRGGIAILSPGRSRASAASPSPISALLHSPSPRSTLTSVTETSPRSESAESSNKDNTTGNASSDIASSDMGSSVFANSPSVYAPSLSSMSANLTHRHGVEWERSEHEIRALEHMIALPNKWEEYDKSKRDRNRLLTPDEEREAKKMEKRQSKIRILPQKGIIGALGTLPRHRPDGPSRAISPSLDNVLTSPEDMVTDANGKVVGLTIDRLIQRLTSDSFVSAALSKSFLMAYRLYMTPLDLLKAFESRWDAEGPPMPEKVVSKKEAQMHLTPTRLRLLTLIKQWAFKSKYDEMAHDDVKQALLVLGHKLEKCGVVNFVKEVEDGLYRKRDSGADLDDLDDNTHPPTPFWPPIGGELVDFHPLELARQITLLEKAYMDNIKPQELITLAWTKKNKETAAPNVMKMVRFSNFLVDWICSEILKPLEPIQRAMIISRFIYVGHYCLELNSFNACVEVLSALRRSSVYRLRRSWNYLSDRAWTVFEQLESLFEPDANYKNYRSVLEKVQPPCVPYIGRLLSDILFLDEKEPTMLGSGDMANLVKLEAMSAILKFLADQQYHEYQLMPVETIVSYIYSREVYNEKQAYNLSLERERKHDTRNDKLSRAELSPSGLSLSECLSRSDAFSLFRVYLDTKGSSNLLVFYRGATEWTANARADPDQSKRSRELASLIFETYISEKSEQHVVFSKDPFIQASIQEMEWKIKDDHKLQPTFFKPLLDATFPELHHHFELFRRSLPVAPHAI